MRLAALHLWDFRNFERQSLNLAPGVNLVTGPNGAGKTNVLEAIHLLGTSRSHRTARDREMVRWGRHGYVVRGELEGTAGRVTLEVRYALGEGKRLLVNGRECAQASGLIGRLPVVLFSPDDLLLVKGGPHLRRRLLDRTLAQAGSRYLAAWQRYKRALFHRNALLRRGLPRGEAGSLLEAWDHQMAEAGAVLVRERSLAVSHMGAAAAGFYDMLACGEGAPGERLAISYQPSVSLPAEAARGEEVQAFLEALARLRGEEVARGVSLVGPHRDDLRIVLGGRSASAHASQGQQRSAVLALKLAQVGFLAEATGKDPILLLDDVMSELDEGRRARLGEVVARWRLQSMVTSTERAGTGLGQGPQDATFAVFAGRVEGGWYGDGDGEGRG